MKKKATILLLALCLVFLAACGSSSPTDALKADLENAKSSPDEIIKGLGADGFGEDATKALIDKVLEFDYEFGEEKIDGDTATVETTITTYPFGEIFTNIITKMLGEDLDKIGKMNETEAAAYLDEQLTSSLNDAKKDYSKTITVTLKKESGKWVVQEDDAFSNALTGGMLDFAQSMSN